MEGKYSMSYRNVIRILLHAAVFVLALCCVSYAVDGVVEINQAKVMAGGVSNGDAPGFPASITTPGSYRLTGNLEVSSTTADGIEITTGNVTIDLNGFSITGPGKGIGSGDGIHSNQGILTVYNGNVRAFGGHGVRAAGVGNIRNVQGRTNGSHGILVEEPGSQVRDCGAEDNGSDGINVADWAVIKNNTAYQNGGSGIVAGENCTISANSVAENSNFGIEAADNAVVESNTAKDNGADGINLGRHAVVRANTSMGNGEDGINTQVGANIQGNTVTGNTNNGVCGRAGSIVIGNVARGNGGNGLDLVIGVGYGNNVMELNAIGSVNTGIELSTNICNGNTTCP